MLNKHFFKTVVLFTSLIAFGLLVVFIVGYFGEEVNSEPTDISFSEN